MQKRVRDLKFTIKYDFDDETIKLFLYLYYDKDRKQTKREFLNYVKAQVRLFGIDYESQFPDRVFKDFTKGIKEVERLYEKWFLYGR